MPFTNGGLWYPLETASPDVPHDMQLLAESVDAAIPPIGSLVDYAGAGDPADVNWLLADGRAISRTTYAALFAVIGTIHGVGNGSTTFNIPDARDRVIAGPSDMGTAQGAAGRTTANMALGNSGGEEKHQLSVAEMPAHSHPGSYWTYYGFGGGTYHSFVETDSATNINQDVVVASQGGDTPHNNMQPTLRLNKIIRVQ